MGCHVTGTAHGGKALSVQKMRIGVSYSGTGFYVESLGVMVRLPGDCTVLWLAVVGLTWLVVSYFETVIFYILMAKTVRLPLGLVLCCSVIGPRRSCTVAPCG